MPSSAEHKAKAEENIAFLSKIKLASPGWAAIVAFYAALHLVERLCACDNLHNGKHQDRIGWLNKHKKHRVIHADFCTLFDASLVARYGTVNQFHKAFPGDSVEEQLVQKNLAAIEKHVANHFATSASTAPPNQKTDPPAQ